jgi:hypothetical protein
MNRNDLLKVLQEAEKTTRSVKIRLAKDSIDELRYLLALEGNDLIQLRGSSTNVSRAHRSRKWDALPGRVVIVYFGKDFEDNRHRFVGQLAPSIEQAQVNTT